MTEGTWTCQTCGHKEVRHISDFVEVCPKCKEKYKFLATVVGHHVVHTYPIFCRKKDWPKNPKVQRVAPLAFYSPGYPKIYLLCKEAAVVRFLKKMYKDNPHIVVLLEKKGENPFKYIERDVKELEEKKVAAKKPSVIQKLFRKKR